MAKKEIHNRSGPLGLLLWGLDLALRKAWPDGVCDMFLSEELASSDAHLSLYGLSFLLAMTRSWQEANMLKTQQSDLRSAIFFPPQM
mmetsp:Transcript_85005/g.177666  ORF Transcript_85005/g.177666 Transcript_85005/m.177666 type:complete len:87 (-) Transcript_85005:514-774(-)